MKVAFLLIITTLSLVYCTFDVEFLNRTSTFNKRQVLGDYPIFKVTKCPPSGKPPLTGTTTPTVGKYLGVGCTDTLTNTDLTLKGVCYPNPSTDTELGAQSYTFVINYILDASNGNSVYGEAFFIKDYDYGKILVIVDRSATVGDKTNVYYNSFDCSIQQCGGCKASKSITDVSGTGGKTIISAGSSSTVTVNFCVGSGTTCCADVPQTCVPTTYSIEILPTPSTYGCLYAPSAVVRGITATQFFTLPIGASAITSFGFYVHSGNVQITYDVYLYEWNVAGKFVVDPILFTASKTITRNSFVLDTFTFPSVNLDSTKTYAAIATMKDQPSGTLYIQKCTCTTPPAQLKGAYTTKVDIKTAWSNTGWSYVGFSATFI